MMNWTIDPTFYPSARLAMDAPPEKLAYVVAFNPKALSSDHSTKERGDVLAVIDVDPDSKSYSQILSLLEMPYSGDELHHYGWNACSSALCPNALHPQLERRYLIVPGLRSSRIYIIDTKPDPKFPSISKIIEPETLMKRTGYSRPHTVHCGPDGIYISALGNNKGEGPGGIFVMDHFSFEPLGMWEIDRGPQYYAYDFWWHINQDILLSSEWGTPPMIENGVVGSLLMDGQYGHSLHVWDLRKRKHLKALDLGNEYQMALEVRPAHDPRKLYGFLGVVISRKDLSASVWLWFKEKNDWQIKKVIEIPALKANPEALPSLLQPFGMVPPLVTDIDLSLDDKYLYVSCWGTGELHKYDVSDPFHPVLEGCIKIGGIVARTPHPKAPQKPLLGGPQMVEISRDGKRIYLTNSLYWAWDEQFYPAGIEGWLVKIKAESFELEKDFFVEFPGFRPHQVRLQGGDSSTDSFCFP
ncbi:selenium-binding protein SBP56-related protein [Methylacidiphilum kamchatkense]